MNDETNHPMQPVVLVNGVARFKGNGIIKRLFDEGRINVHEIALWLLDERSVSVEDAEQFWQLLGYSVSGYGDLSFIRRATVDKADEAVEELLRRKG